MKLPAIIQNWQDYIVAIIAIIGTSLAFWNYVKSALLGAYRTGKGITGFFKSFGDLQTQVKDIHKEVKPNHGSSMRDEIQAIRKEQIEHGALEQARFNLCEEAQWKTDAAGKIINVNRRYCELVGQSVEDVLGHNWKITIHPDDLGRVASEWEHIVRDGRDSVITHRIVKPNGTIIEVTGKGEAMVGPKGEVLGWFGTLTPVPPQSVEHPVHAQKRTRVLMVEDAADTLSLFEIGLSPYFDVQAASSGRDAIQSFVDAQGSGRAFDAIIMDYAMPDMDGVETVRHIRERETVRNHTVVMFFTGNEHKISDQNKSDYQISAIIKKPTSPIEVVAQLTHILKQKP